MEWKECGKTKVMRNSSQQSPVQIVMGQKQLEYVEYFKYLCSVITNDARCTSEIISRIAMAKAIFNGEKKNFSPAN
jgi:hypothetical protein